MDMRVLSRPERAGSPSNHLTVFEHVRSLEDVNNADLVAKGDVLSERDLSGCLSLQRADSPARPK